MNIAPELYEEVAEALKSAKRSDLVERMQASATDTLTSTQAAELLGVASVNTVKNWLEGGHFPGAFQTVGGHWRFPHSDVLAAKERMQALKDKNCSGDLDPPDTDEHQDPPLL